MADEKEWLAKVQQELRHYITLIIEDYDNGRLTLDAAKGRIGIMVKDSLSKTYDHAFTEGINAADLDGDSEEEVDFETEFEIDDEGDEHP